MHLELAEPVLVVFEGLDGTGKSRCAGLVAERLGADYMTTPSVALREVRARIIDDLGPSQEACQLFYLATVFSASETVRRLLREGRSVVLDRYVLSTQAYAAFRGSSLGLDFLSSLLQPADLTVVLTAPLAVRAQRVTARGGSPADAETLSPVADARLNEEHAQRFSLPALGSVLEIDTSIADPNVVVELVLSKLRRMASARYR